MSRKYPRVEGYRRKPDAAKDGDKNYGKPCIFCGTSTVGEKWIQVSYMRGEDETVRVCAEDWLTPDDVVLDEINRQAGWRNE